MREDEDKKERGNEKSGHEDEGTGRGEPGRGGGFL